MKRIGRVLPQPGLNEIFQPQGESINPAEIAEHINLTFPWGDPSSYCNTSHSTSGGVQYRSVQGTVGAVTVDTAGGVGPPSGFTEQVLAVCLFHDDPTARALFLKIRGTDTLTGGIIELLVASSFDTPVASRSSSVNAALIWQPNYRMMTTQPGGLHFRGEANAMDVAARLTIVRFTFVFPTGQPML